MKWYVRVLCCFAGVAIMVASLLLALYCNDIVARWILLTFGYGTFLYGFVSIMWITFSLFTLMPGFLLARAAFYDFSDDDDDEDEDEY
jgi:hypothetical protein